jgi:alkyl hydroperoxide reductase subunit AhpC
MIVMNKKAPDIRGTVVVGGPSDKLTTENAFKELSLSELIGRWVVLFFYPSDFSVVCPTELVAFAKAYDSFRARNAEVIAVSTDSQHSHLAWRRQEDSLKQLPYPMMADSRRDIARSFDVLDDVSGTAMRALFILDPDGVVQYMTVHNDDVGRSVDETSRVLDALQTNVPCPCDWQKDAPTLVQAEGQIA